MPRLRMSSIHIVYYMQSVDSASFGYTSIINIVDIILIRITYSIVADDLRNIQQFSV